MRKYILLTLIILTITSCKLVLNTFYGIKKPKTETKQSILKYLNRKEIESNNVYTVNYSDFNKISSMIGGIPEIMVFDNAGKLIEYKDDAQCNASAFDFIKNLSLKQSFKYNDSINLDSFLLKLKDFEGNHANIKKEEKYDYYLIIFWARYTGRLNKDHVKIWENYANNNKNCNIKVLKVDMDIQKWWHK